jgi:hypothetical protein
MQRKVDLSIWHNLHHDLPAGGGGLPCRRTVVLIGYDAEHFGLEEFVIGEDETT